MDAPCCCIDSLHYCQYMLRWFFSWWKIFWQVSVGYFLSDLGMIFWLYPSLGGMEYVIHHSLSGIAVAYSMASGEGQLYTYMVLISEITTPEINMRWFLDTSGMKKSAAYLINGIVIFIAWLVARVLLFVYLFYHVYLHYHQVIEMHIFGYLLVFVVPAALALMNLMWFGKIIKGLMKTLAKKRWRSHVHSAIRFATCPPRFSVVKFVVTLPS